MLYFYNIFRKQKFISNRIIMSHPKCTFANCSNPAKYKVRNNWGAKPSFSFFCEEHAPEWIKQGKKESPVAQLGNIKKSFYTLMEVYP